MNFDQFSANILSLIGQGKLDQAIQSLSTFLKHTPAADEMVLHSARNQDLKKQIRQGTISLEEADVTKNKIRLAIMELLHEVEEAYLQNPSVKAAVDSSLTRLAAEKKITQIHYGSGDNVAGDKIVNE